MEHNTSRTTHNANSHNNITRHYKPIPEQFPEHLLKSFWKRVDRRGPSQCWPWLGATTTGIHGGTYGVWRGFRPHRVTYTLLVGPIPDGHTLDHLRDREGRGACTTTLCCNPAHTEPVTQSVNTKRYRASLPRICKRGHRMPAKGNCGTCIQIMGALWKRNNPERVKEANRRYEERKRQERNQHPVARFGQERVNERRVCE